MNASPLILLSKIGQIDLLRTEGVDVVIPATVLDEVSRRGHDDPAVRAIRGAGWEVAAPVVPVPESVGRWKLDAGEEAVLSLAVRSPGCEVVIDDRAGRSCAEAHGLALIGTLGIVILARRIGRIAEARPLILELRRAGLRVSDDVIATALKRAGESQ